LATTSAVLGDGPQKNGPVAVVLGPQVDDGDDRGAVPSYPDVDGPAVLVDFLEKESVPACFDHEFVRP